jgi:DNA-binding MarR family transcriptional regulator
VSGVPRCGGSRVFLPDLVASQPVFHPESAGWSFERVRAVLDDKIYRFLLRVVKDDTVHNPTVRQLCMLIYLDSYGEITVREVARLFHIPRPAVSANATRLEEQQMIARKPDPNNHRSVLLTITPRGHTYLTNVMSH